MVEQDRTRPAAENRRPPRDTRDAGDTRDTGDVPGGQDRPPTEEAPGGAVTGEIGRVRGEPGASDPAGDADLDPRADAERMAGRVVDDVDHNDEAD